MGEVNAYKAVSNTTISRTRLYHIWVGMRVRCTDEKCPAYKNYGGRGITICPEWQTDYMAFEDWAYSNGYREYLTIDRIDNDKGYSPGNCRWATRYVQNHNKRPCHISKKPLYEINGELKTAEEWAAIAGITRKRFNTRWERGKRGTDLIKPKQQQRTRQGGTP